MSLKQTFDDQLLTIKQNVKRKSTLYSFTLKCIENYMKYLTDFSKKIESIVKDISNNKVPDNFNSFFFALKEFFSNRKKSLDQNIIDLTELQKQLGQFCSKWTQTDNQISKEIINTEKAFLKLINDFEQTKKNFVKTNMSCVTRLVKYEQSKASPLQLASLDQQHKQIQNELAHASQIERSYQELQVECNLENDKYQESLKLNLRKYVDLDQDMTNAFKQLLKSVIKTEKDNIMLELSRHEENTKNDNLITYNNMNDDKKNYTVIEVPMRKIEPFQPSILHNNTNRFEDEITYNVIKVLKNKLTYVALDYNVEKEGTKLFLTKVCKNILEGKDIFHNMKSQTDNLHEKLYGSISKKEFHLHFLMYLNYKRAEGKFRLTRQSFFHLGSIMKNILNAIKGNADNCETLRYCLILSQTYYFLNAKKEKVYCIRYFEDMEVFKGKEFWKFFFEENINQEIEKANNMPGMPAKDKNMQLQNIVFSKILSFVHNMFELRIGKDLVKDIALIFCEKYQLEEELVKQIMIMINDYISVEKQEFNIERDLEEEVVVNESENNGSNQQQSETKQQEGNEEKKEDERNNANAQENKNSNVVDDNKQNETQTQNNEEVISNENVTSSSSLSSETNADANAS